MKKILVGFLLGAIILNAPINSRAYERQCPKPIEMSYEEAQELMKIAFCEAGKPRNRGAEVCNVGNYKPRELA